MAQRPMHFNQDPQPDSTSSPQRRSQEPLRSPGASTPGPPPTPGPSAAHTPVTPRPTSPRPTSPRPTARPTSLRPPSVSVQQRMESTTRPPTTATRSPHTIKPPAPLSSWGTYFFLLTMILTIAVAWSVGPRLVEEYHYAAAVGKARGEYAHAVERLEQAPLTEVSLAYQMVAQRIRPSVVSVRAIKSKDVGFGSGVILSSDGYIMSNAHVIKDAGAFQIELYDRRRVTAKLIGVDNESDLAVLKIEANNLIPATWGDSDSLEVGSMVWAIGSPYEFNQTITSGILSGKNRRGDLHHSKQTLLQTDAAVNPGNSGGPLVDIQGKVIGINTSIYGETFQGISFAVPSATAEFVFEQLVTNQKVSRGYLGLKPIEVSERLAKRFGLPDLEGAYVRKVGSDSPAYEAGIRQGDILHRWNGQPIRNYRQVFRFAEGTPVGSEATVGFLRRNNQGTLKQHSAKVIVGQSQNSPVTMPSKFERDR